MKSLILLTSLVIASFIFTSCDNTDSARNGTSNSRPDRGSLPSPDPPRNGVDANGNATVASNTNLDRTAANQNDDSRNNFWITAAQGGVAEVELSKIAQTKATSLDVKQFARMMVADHGKANAELKALARKKGITLPTTMNSGNQATLTELQNLSGPDFDFEYIKAMIDNHEADVQLFESQSQDDTDPEAKAFAAKTLPVLQKHLAAIKALQQQMR